MNEGVSNVKDFESYEIGLRVCSEKQGTACPPMKIGICVHMKMCALCSANKVDDGKEFYEKAPNNC